jgi:small GTP-binding protein
MQRILDPAGEAEVARARDLLGSLRDALTEFRASSADTDALISSIRQLDELFLIVVVGEFNAGKSAFLNALLGSRVLTEGVTPTTAHIHVLTHGDQPSESVGPDGVRTIFAPVELLRELSVVDTPGTNAIIREHERLTTEFVPRSDLVLFVTSAERPFTETERAFIEAIRSWRKKIIIVVNKIDILGGATEVDEVLRFVERAARDLFAWEPEVFPVSARLALRAKQGEPSHWAESRFEPFEQYLVATLDAPNRYRLKLANPLGVGHALAQRYANIAAERLIVLADDLQLLNDIETQLAAYRADMVHGFNLRMSAIEAVLTAMEMRGHRFFEDTLRIGRVVDLLNRTRVQKEFEETVVADAPLQIERRATELIDWLVDQDFRQWQAVTTKLTDRHRQHASRMLGAPDIGPFHMDRSRLIESVGREAQRALEGYDKRREAEAIADQARGAVAAAAAAGGAAVGLGTLVTIAASTVAADVTGILLASVIFGVGFLIIPARRRRAKATLVDKLSALRGRLTDVLRAEFERAQERSRNRLADAVAPYTRFVRAEEKRWADARGRLTALANEAGVFLSRLETSPSASGKSPGGQLEARRL